MKAVFCLLSIFCLIAQSYSFLQHPTKGIDVSNILKLTQKYFGKRAQNFLATTNINQDVYAGNLDDSDSSVAIMEQFYYGTWVSTTTDYIHQFEDFSQNTGYSAFTAQDENSDGIDDDIYFWFYDGQYIDQKVGIINFQYNNLTDFNVANSTFKNDSIMFILYKKDNFQKVGTFSCTGSYQLSLVDSTTNLPYNQTTSNFQNAVAYFWLNSTDCSINVQSTVSIANAMSESKALDYSLMVTVICLAHLYAVVQMIKNVSQNEYDGARYSLISLLFFAIWDVFMCLFHLYDALSIQNFFHYFITPAFWYFILASIFETRLILIVWKIRYYQTFQTANEIRRGITVFYLKFYGSMLAALILAYNFLPSLWFICLTCPFFIPQIVHNAIRGQKYRFDPMYVFLLGFVRIAIPLYVRGCPASIFKLTPSSSFLEFYTGFVIFQIFGLYLQAKLGSRFFIPRFLLPPKYNYFMKLPVDASPDEAETCSICMENLNEAVITSSTGLLSSPKQVTVMVTPCRHKFHPTCLRQWMEVKLECPFCRAPTPPLD